MNALQKVKEQTWFYEFPLPDGTKTQCYLPLDVRKIHTTREKVLRDYIQSHNFPKRTALDVSCHEGFFSFVLGDYFGSVQGIDKNEQSIAMANQMLEANGRKNIYFTNCLLEDISSDVKSDFVLCYGLIYHIENPMYVLRKLAKLTTHTLCIETQIFPFALKGKIEDGSYRCQRDVKGIFALCEDYPTSKEGGTTEYALVPSLDAVTYLLGQFGFSSVRVYEPKPDDYEQFTRGNRAIIFAEKNA